MDKERILKKIDELDSYLNEIHDFIPKNFKEYANMQQWMMNWHSNFLRII